MTNWQSLSELSTDLGESVALLTNSFLSDRLLVVFDRLMHALLSLYVYVQVSSVSYFKLRVHVLPDGR